MPRQQRVRKTVITPPPPQGRHGTGNGEKSEIEGGKTKNKLTLGEPRSAAFVKMGQGIRGPGSRRVVRTEKAVMRGEE